MTQILITCGNLLAGGAERVISILANNFVQKDIDVSIYTWYKTDVFYSFDDRVKIIQIPETSGRKDFPGQMKWFRKKISSIKPDVILSFLAPFNILTAFSLVGINIPIIVAERNDPYFVSPKYNWFWKIVRNIAYGMSDGVLVQTLMNKSHFPWYIQKKSEIIYNPVIFTKDRIGEALRVPKRKEIVSVTRLEKQKNVDMLIEAFYHFHKVHDDYILTIYGEGQCRSNLEMKIKKLGLNNCISLPGKKVNVHDLILGASIYAMASNFEGMSNSLIEAMCLGLPCISTKVSGATDLIKDHQNGILVGIGDVDAMAEAMTELAESECKRKTLGEKSSELYEILNVDAIAEQWLNYIKKFI